MLTDEEYKRYRKSLLDDDSTVNQPTNNGGLTDDDIKRYRHTLLDEQPETQEAPPSSWWDKTKSVASYGKNLLKSAASTVGSGIVEGSKYGLTGPVGYLANQLAPDELDKAKNYLESMGQNARNEVLADGGPELDKPLLDIKTPLKNLLRSKGWTGNDSPVSKFVTSAGSKGLDLAQGLTTPENLALLGTGAFGKIPEAVAATSFLPGLVKGTAKGGQEVIEGFKQGDYAKAGAGTAEALGTGLFTYGLGEHLLDANPTALKTLEKIKESPVEEPAIPLLPEKTDSTLQAEKQAVLKTLQALPKSSDLSLDTDSAPERIEVKGPETFRDIKRKIEPEKKTKLVDADKSDPDAFYDFNTKKFVKEADITPKVFLGEETVKEPTGFITREEVTPETKNTVKYQMDSLDAGRSKAVLLTPGEELAGTPNKRFKTLDTDVGKWVYDPLKVSAKTIKEKVKSGTHGEILGHVEPKSPLTTKIVEAVKNGEELKTSVVSPQNVVPQYKELKRQFPDAEVKVGDQQLAKQVLDQRVSAPEVNKIPEVVNNQVNNSEISGDGEKKTVGLSKSLEQSAANKKIADSLGELPEYNTVNWKDQFARADQFIKNNPEAAKKIAMGDESLTPKGLLPEAVMIQVNKSAQKLGDIHLIRDIATSDLARKSSVHAQRLSILSQVDPHDPVTAIRDIVKTREEVAKKRYGEKLGDQKSKIVEEIKKETRRTAPTKETWENFVNSITC